MKCDLVGGSCRNCGGVDSDAECPAEATLDELLAMESGQAPRRAVRITAVQAAALAGQHPSTLTDSEIAELLPGESDPTLIGNRIEAAIKQFGIPPCEGCGSRRDWLNSVHAYFRELAAGLAG